MAEVVPFKGVRYNPELISEMAAVVAPPYDVITPEEQDVLYRRHPSNVIRLILGRHQPGDTADDNVHTRAGRHFRTWMDQRILVSDPAPCFYLTSVEFTSNARLCTRFGIIGRVRLEPFEKGIVLPHERTFSKIKSERLMLMKACHANFSPIFGLYADGSEILQRLHAIAETQPAVNLVDDKGHRHRLWCISDEGIASYLVAFFKNQRIYIADGHHRYETALAYRDWVKQTRPDYSSDHPSNFVMFSLSSMVDPGMIILPAHRLLKDLSAQQAAEFTQRAGEFFDVTRIAVDKGMEEALAEFSRTLHSQAHRHAIGLFSSQPAVMQVMVLKEGVMARLFKDQIPAALRDLDVTILTHVIMMELMGFDQEQLDDETKIIFRTTIKEAVQVVGEGKARMAFILNPTKIEQVRRVAEQGLIMPRKSTYFYPKVISGLVFNLLR
ncbi:MAG: DUF1015 domain-containing protein [Desulfobacteraceae bacterium]|nr:MAG: DUF1015 domain-containing protein [Desulfobacteraceae bacterium]